MPIDLPWKWLGVGAGALLLVAVAYFGISAYGKARYENGLLEERSIWEGIVAEQTIKLEKLQRQADALLEAQREADWARAERERKELEDAIKDIPDQATTNRQRATACVELRRQGQAPPACDTDTTS